MITARQSEKAMPTTIEKGDAKPLSLATNTKPAVAPAAGAIRAADWTTAPPRPVEPDFRAEIRCVLASIAQSPPLVGVGSVTLRSRLAFPCAPVGELQVPIPGVLDGIVDLFDQGALLDPHRRGSRKGLLPVLDVAGDLVLGEPLAAELDELHRGHGAGVDALDQADVGLDLLAAELVGHGDDRGLQHLGMRSQHVLDLGRRDVLPGPAHDVLLAAEEVEEPLLIATRQVTAVKPALGEGLRGGIGA